MMPSWEYLRGQLRALIAPGDDGYDATLNRLGASGWELVAVSVAPDAEPCLWFKRQCEEEAADLPEGLGGPRTCP